MPVFVVLRSLISIDLHDAVVGSEVDHALRLIECPFVALNRYPYLSAILPPAWFWKSSSDIGYQRGPGSR